MPRRVNLTILLGLITIIVLSFGLSARAAQEEGEDSAGNAASGDDAVEEARGELEQLQWEVQAAHGARLNADEKKQQIADTVADTQGKLAAAEEDSVGARHELADTASQVYKEGGVGDVLGVLLGADSFGGFAERVDLAVRLLSEKRNAVQEADKAKEQLAKELEQRQKQLEDWQTTDAEKANLEERVQQAEDNVRAHLDALPEDVRQELDTERDQQVDDDRARGEEILKQLAQDDPSAVAQAQAPAEVQTTTEKLADLRDIERQAEEGAVQKIMEAEQARQVAQQEIAIDQANLQASSNPQAAKPQAAKPQVAAQGVKRQAAGQPPEVSNDTNGVVDAGDRLKVEGKFKIKPGATVTFEDADGTRGTAIDGVNAHVVEGSIDTTMTAPLENVSGGDGVMDTTGELGVVDTTGITSTGEFGAGQQAAPGVGGLQYAPATGTAPIPGAVGLNPATSGQPGLNPTLPGQPRLNPAASGQPGLQPASSAIPAAGGRASGSAIVAEAMSWLGTPYSFGGTSRDGISCSGLVMMVYGKFGVSLPNSPGGILDVIGKLNSGSAPAGAIVLFSEDGSGSPTHVGLSNGDGTMTDANVVKGQVGITPIDVVTGYMGWGYPPGF